MRIAQVAPLVESVPPRFYGGTERVIAGLMRELSALGHEVTLYATGDSTVEAGRKVTIVEKALWSEPNATNEAAFHTVELAQVLRDAADYDVIHSHVDFTAFPFERFSPVPWVHTLHGRLDAPEWPALTREFPDARLISVSDSQRRPIAGANWLATVHNGIALEDVPIGEGKGGYLAFLGRISPEKGLADAIEVAKRAAMPLKIAARMPLENLDNAWVRADWTYYRDEVKPRIQDSSLVEFVGQLNDADKYALLRDAAGLLFPINWPEPFGLVMIEALACGTPVIARSIASAPEIVIPGYTGFLCADLDEMAGRCAELGTISRWTCREDVETRFSARAMAEGYLRAYRLAVGGDDCHIAIPIAQPAPQDRSLV